MHGGMAACRKACPRRYSSAVGLFADGWKIHLRVAAQAKVVVARDKHLLMNRSVYLVAGGAAFRDGFMFKNKRALLFFMTIEASFVDSLKGSRGPGTDFRAVGAVAGSAVHFAFEHGMMMRQAEFHFLF